MAHLAQKAFAPAKTPFPFVHVDTGHNFEETIEYRDAFVEKLGVELIVGQVQDSIDRGTAEETGPDASRNALQSVTLLETIDRESLDACLGGGRRDEEKARAKERFFSHRDAFGQWDLKIKDPNFGTCSTDERAPVKIFGFPNEQLDGNGRWQHAKIEEIELPSLYFAHEREVLERNGSLLAVSEFVTPEKTKTHPPKPCVSVPSGTPLAPGRYDQAPPTSTTSFRKWPLPGLRNGVRGPTTDDRKRPWKTEKTRLLLNPIHLFND